MTTKEKENLVYKDKNIIRILPNELDMPIYRVFSKKWLIDALTKKKNALVKPSMWKDPFENFIFRSTAYTNNGVAIGFDSIRENFYGQCWTFNQEETDALWRIYSPDKDGFRVKTTIRKMFDSFYDLSHVFALVSFFVGKIKYETEANIKKYFEDPNNLKKYIFDSAGNGHAETLLIKRMEFKHENELRFVFLADKSWYDTNLDSYEFPIDINYHFEEILADPRMDEISSTFFSDSMEEIKELGYTNSIEKSTLYQIPNLNLRLDIDVS